MAPQDPHLWLQIRGGKALAIASLVAGVGVLIWFAIKSSLAFDLKIGAIFTGLVFLALAPLLWWIVQIASQIRFSDQGVEWRGLLGEDLITWSEIYTISFGLGRGGLRLVTIRSRRRRIVFSNVRPGFWPAVLYLIEEGERRDLRLKWPLFGGRRTWLSARPHGGSAGA